MPVIAGTSLEKENRIIQANGLLVKMQEHFDPFILNWQLKHPSIFRDRIPMGRYEPFQGASQESFIFRGSNDAPQAGLADWRDVTPTALGNPGNDRCSYQPKTYTWSWDKIGYSGKRREWRSPVFCVMDLYTQDAAKDQLSMIITAGSEVTDQTREVYNRESYMKLAVNANKFVVLAEGLGLSYIDNPAARVSYDPAKLDTDGVSTYIEFDTALADRVSTLNWSPFNLVRAYLADAAPDAAQGMDSGMPIFTLLIDLLDFEEMIFNNPSVREDMRYAEAKQLIAGYNMGFKIYRGMGIVHDVRQARFDGGRIVDGKFRCRRVLARRAVRPGVVGMIPETNPDYVTAPYGTAVLFLNNVAEVRVPDVISNLGSSLTFGPAPGFNGQWQWINNKGPDNPIGEIGFFFSRFEYHLKAMRYAEHAMVFLYKRCQQVLKTDCPIVSDIGADASSTLAKVPVAADFSATNGTVRLTLAKKLTKSAGARVTIKNDAGAVFSAFIMDAQNAPVYTFGWALGGANVPTAVAEIDGLATVLVTVV